mgnify:CR=1 FL=1
MKSWLWIFVGVCLLGCEQRGPQVVVYVSTDEAIASPILDAFQVQTGITVLIVGDTEARKTTGLIERIETEGGQPVGDVLWSSEGLGTARLQRQGLLAPHHSATTASWPEAWRSSDQTWFAFSPRPRVLVYDPARVNEGDLPQVWSDLADPTWRDHIVIADPRFGTTGGHFATMRSWMAEASVDSWPSFLEGLQANRVRMLPGGNAAVVDAIRHGDALIGATDADDVHAANRQGAELAMAMLPHGPQTGPMLMPNTVAILAGARHPREAALLVDWLLSDEVARMLAASDSRNIPLQPDVAAQFPELMVEHPLVPHLPDIERHATGVIEEVVTAIREHPET